MSARVLLIVTCLSLCLLQPARAQPDLLDMKELAKAKRELATADLRQLAQARATAAQTAYRARARDDRGSIYDLLDAAERFREARLALTDDEAERRAVREAHWLALRWIDSRMEAVYYAGRVGIRDYLTARYARLDADIELAQTKVRRQPGATAVVSPAVQEPFATVEEPHDPLQSKPTAKARLETVRADPRSLREAQFDAARIGSRAQMGQFISGRGSYYLLLRWAERLRRAEERLAGTEPDRLAALEHYWLTTWQDEMHQKLRAELGRTVGQSYWHPRYYRLAAEAELARAWAQRESRFTRAPVPKLYGFYPLSDVDGRYIELGDILGAKLAAKAKANALRVNPVVQERLKLETVRLEYEYREYEFLRIRNAFGLQDAARRLMRSELGAADANRTAAREVYWARLKWTQLLYKALYESRRVSIQTYAESERALREAEIDLVQSRQRERTGSDKK